MPDSDNNEDASLDPEQAVLALFRGLAPGWYRDYQDPAFARYWDGVALGTQRQAVVSGPLKAETEGDSLLAQAPSHDRATAGSSLRPASYLEPGAPPVANGTNTGASPEPFEGAPASSRRNARIALAAVLIGFVVMATVIAIKTPAYESADEPSHVRNIETLVAGHWYGMSSMCHFSLAHKVLVDCSGTEAHQPPLYYLVLAGWQRAMGIGAHTVNPGPARLGDLGGGLFFHHSVSTHQFLLWLRLPNVLLGVLTIFFTFLAIRTLTSDPWTPVVGAAIVAYWPRFVFLSAFVTNDNLVDLLGAVLTYLSLRYLTSPTKWRLCLVAGTCGLLVITKLSALPVAIVVVLVLPLFRRPTPRLVWALLLGMATFIGVCGWYLVQNTVRYGDPLAVTGVADLPCQSWWPRNILLCPLSSNASPGTDLRAGSNPDLGQFLVHVGVESVLVALGSESNILGGIRLGALRTAATR